MMILLQTTSDDTWLQLEEVMRGEHSSSGVGVLEAHRRKEIDDHTTRDHLR